jgi:hypothetical protein
MRGGRVDTKSYFLGHLDGWTARQCYRALGLLTSLRGANRAHILVQQFFQSGDPQASADAVRSQETGAPTAALQLKLTNKMARDIQALRDSAARMESAWATYVDDNTYSAEASALKDAFVKDALREFRPGSVIDLGSNTGRFSRIAAEHGANVLAVDGDQTCVDALYKAEVPGILPLWMDLSNPSPAFGFGGTERKDFFARASGDMVLALALFHHLLVTDGIEASLIADTFYRLTTRFLIVEYVSPQDPQFKRIVGLRNRDYSFITERYFTELFSRSGRTLKMCALSPTRSLFLFEKTTS